eukprot:1159674-Pelagomonas_calceolata.AAC.6
MEAVGHDVLCMNISWEPSMADSTVRHAQAAREMQGQCVAVRGPAKIRVCACMYVCALTTNREALQKGQHLPCTLVYNVFCV